MPARLMLHPTAFKCRHTTNLVANAHADKESAVANQFVDGLLVEWLRHSEFAFKQWPDSVWVGRRVQPNNLDD